VSAGETFGACGCPVTTAGVLHNIPCGFGGARARAYVRADALKQADDQPRCVWKIRVNFGLTERELEAATMLGRGFTNKEIAQALCIQLQGAKDLMSGVMRKTASSNRTIAALRLAGWLKP
jgi:DNA-binding NarL/FixJ family response regulator